jgi:hypothetical protein
MAVASAAMRGVDLAESGLGDTVDAGCEGSVATDSLHAWNMHIKRARYRLKDIVFITVF